MKTSRVREAVPEDIKFLLNLEKKCFPPHRQSDRRSLKTSIASTHQYVYILELGKNKTAATDIGSATIFRYKNSLRIYSIAIDPDFRHQGVGSFFMQYIAGLALQQGFEKITLEVDCENKELVEWYKKMSFEITEVLNDYYAPGEAAYRMNRKLGSLPEGQTHAGNIIVVDNAKKWNFESIGVKAVCAKDYLSAEQFRNSERYHILNLCSSYKTHSMGYYVSLLASARNHKILPTVTTVKDISSVSIAQSLLDEINDFVQTKLKGIQDSFFELSVFLGTTPKHGYHDLAKKLFALFEIPFFNIVLYKNGSWKLKKVNIFNLSAATKQSSEQVHEAIKRYFHKKRYRKTQLKKYKYDLAILANSAEKTPPSCPLALSKFKKAAEKVGFMVEFINKMDYRRICEFDALFIRETTAIENHTYKFARYAYTEGLVVIDDPWSIMLCSNKIYLNERLERYRIKKPKAWLLTKNMTPALLKELHYPLVLKLPESSFSLGVYKVKNPEELHCKLTEMFKTNDLVIAQEFLQSEFDWRIGMLDNTPLFACKYYMAQGHWQIYNWENCNNAQFLGNSETLPINQVPPHVIKAAVRSSSLIGDGFYGVDIKDINGQAYVIEVNDNPNVDAGIEDLLLQDELYMRIMNSILNRIERDRNQPSIYYKK